LLPRARLPALVRRRAEMDKGWGNMCMGRAFLRTKIVVDDELVAEAMRRTGIKTKRAVVEEALRTLIGLKRQEEILALRGNLHWEGDLDEMRRD
jgi:Arc/MetJ family transcription regulator